MKKIENDSKDLHENRSVIDAPASECVNQGEESYWQDVENKAIDAKELRDEFREGEFTDFSPSKSRRDFFKIAGFSFTAFSMASCLRIPTQKVIPFLSKNDQVIPGVATWFSAKYENCNCGAPLILKTREGRPIKVEGNDKSTWTKGGACAVCQASVIELYDSYRLKNPLKNGLMISFDQFFIETKNAITAAKSNKKKVALIVSESNSPSKEKLLNEFATHFGNVSIVPYNAYSNAAENKALEITHGKAGIIEYNFENANLVVSFESDFLGTIKSSSAYARQYAKRREVVNGVKPIRHIQVESSFSFTGSNADTRFALEPYEVSAVLLLLLEKFGGESAAGINKSSNVVEVTNKLFAELTKEKAKSLIISASNDLGIQTVTNKINELLGNWGKTINAFSSSAYITSNDEHFEKFINDLSTNSIYDVVIFADVNPAYSYYDSDKFIAAIKKVPLVVSLAYAQNETSALSHLVAPIHHSYESWNDYVISSKELAIGQAVVIPLYGSKQTTDIFLAIMERSQTYYDFVQEFWKKNYYSKQKQFLTFDGFWDHVVEQGVFPFEAHVTHLPFKNKNISAAVNAAISSISKTKKTDDLSLVLFETLALKDGTFANNPWLQEMPDPVTKLTWDNALFVSPSVAKAKSLKLGDVVELIHNSIKILVPVIVQPGMAPKTVALAVGYGRKIAGKVGSGVGVNAYPFATFINGTFQFSNCAVSITKTLKTYNLALTQTHHSMEGREIVRETTLDKFISNPKAGNEKKTKLITMWSEHKKDGHQWAMAIDLSKCNGCTACVVSCNVENNIPVVGREEVFKRREMHWMRIDRYYKGSDENPTAIYQPMNCQHCDNAPCETVCPVLATVQSSDGLNQQVYNRCVGTRYCANNCPYKVRRFNWFDYPHNDHSQNMVLNPDVVVRSRGVMEKCSLCVQRIQEAKLVAKKEGRELKDGEIKLACQQSCSSDAIVFGDINDPKSEISKKLSDPRNYTVLDELNVRPRVSYLTKIRNKE